MSCNSLRLKGVQQNITSDNISNMLETNLKMYYDWAFLSQLGAWSDVDVPTSGIYGADFSKLRMVSDPNYTDGQVWETPRKDLVWESDIEYANYTGGISVPNTVGNPIVNGVSVSTGYYINYPQGQIVFTNPVAGTVKLQHAYRTVQIYKVDDAPWWREIQQQSFRPDNAQFQQSESGMWSLFSQYRIQLPAVVIEVAPIGDADGYALGADSLRQNRDVLFNVIAETPSERKNLMDIFNAQVARGLSLFNSNEALNEWPLDYRGMLTGTKTYPYFVSESGHRWRTCEMQKSTIEEVLQVHPALFIATVRTTTSTII